MNKPIYSPDNIPTVEEDPEFWATITSPGFKKTTNLLILNEIRRYAPETLTDVQARTQLSKIKAYQELLDFPNALTDSNEQTLTDEIE